MKVEDNEVVEVGVRMTLSFHDRSPAVQVTLTDLRTRVALVREQMRATLAEEANHLLKEEIERHKTTQRRLAGAERLNRSIIESSIDMIVAFNQEGLLTQYNQAFAVEFGLEFGEDATQYPFRTFIATQEEGDRVRNELLENSNFSGETIGKRLNGEHFPMFLTVAVLKDENDETFGAMAVGRDITEAKLAQEELEASEERYRSILDNANDAIFTLDEGGFFTYTNPSFNELLGYSELELSKRTARRHHQPSIAWEVMDQSACAGWSRTGVCGGRRKGVDHAWRRHDPTQRTRQTIWVRGIYLDITDKLRTNAAPSPKAPNSSPSSTPPRT